MKKGGAAKLRRQVGQGRPLRYPVTPPTKSRFEYLYESGGEGHEPPPPLNYSIRCRAFRQPQGAF